MCKWKIKLNIAKTQAIFFTPKRNICNLPNSCLHLSGHTVSWLTNAKYLGVILDTKIIFRDHINPVKNKFSIAIKLLYPPINRNSDLSTDNKIQLCKHIFQSIILYASPVWGACAKFYIKTLQICQNKLLRMMLKLPWDYSTNILHKLSNVKLISEKFLIQ